MQKVAIMDSSLNFGDVTMSIQLINQYYSNVERLIRYGGTRNESSLRKAFQDLLGSVCKICKSG